MKKRFEDFFATIREKIKDKRKFLLAVICVSIVIYVLFNLIPYLVSVVFGHRIVYSDNEIVSELSSSGDLYTYDNNILLFDSNGMQFYDFKGNYKHNLYFEAYSPYVQAKGDNIAVADTNGRTAAVIKNKKIKYTMKSSENIQLISVNKKAYSTLITGEKGYKSLIESYDSKGEKIYQWHMGEHYAVDACVTDNNDYLAVLSVGIDENIVASYVTFINLKEETVHSEYKIENELGYKLTVDNNSAYVITDAGLYHVTSGGTVKNSYKYSGKELLGFDIEDKNHIGLALNENNSESIVVLLDNRFKVKGQCEVPIQVNMLDASKDRISVSGQNFVYVTEKNRIFAKGTFLKDAEYMKLSENGKHIVTTSGNSISIYNIKLGR